MPRQVHKASSHRSTNSRCTAKVMPISIPLEPLKLCHGIDPKERIFLEAAARGDRHTMIQCLQGPVPVNVNCSDMLGRSAIQIAVDNENVEIVELLLKQDGVKIGDALLYAVREGVYKIVEMLIDHPSITPEMIGHEWSKLKYSTDMSDYRETSDYSPDISPVILAAHCNQFEILHLLLQRGGTIDRPHQLSCQCRQCQEQVHEDGLRHSLLRINTYRALASPAWISLTSSDPILSAFKLSWELEKLALRENEFKDMYLDLSDQCKRFACDLLDQCRSSEEVIAVLNRKKEIDSEDEASLSMDFDRLTLTRLKLALKYEQKQFVAHPHCQQLLTSIWYEGLPSWRKRNGVTKFLLCIGLICLLPFMSIYYLIFPRSKIGQLLRSPFMKFLYHSASFGVFLFLLVCASTDIAFEDNREKMRGPPPTELEWLICIWVTGFIWAECKQLWDEGLKAYIRQWWNWLDFIMLSLYLATFALRFVAYFQIEYGMYGPREMRREEWPLWDPTLISEGLFAVANVFSFSRIIYLFQADQYLGPLQISLGCMLIDIAKFLFIFFLVLTSFACGLNQLYWYYNPSKQGNPSAFFTLTSSYRTLYWSLFSLTQVKDIKLEGGQDFTETIGELLFMAYHGLAIIVLTNMLIAMMSNSFQEIENHADMEWKYARSKLWMGYFDEGSTLPPPFNLIISPKAIFYFLTAVKDIICKCISSQPGHTRHQKSFDGNIKRPSYNDNIFSMHGNVYTQPRIPQGITSSYQDIMRRLVSRYIHQCNKERRQDSVNEDDLLEIKQDISSLRYELREDKKQEMAKIQRHLDDLRNDTLGAIWTLKEESGISTIERDTMSRSYEFGLQTPRHVENVKTEILLALKSEIRELAKETAIDVLRHGGGTGLSNFLPTVSSELYQTHLYTQL
ncbi:hypothetical protein CHS0354_006636 [Potamilus streckersoni]|uniref:Transient receptor ion channel domain-containing protein n=1 Tax=Potamilus streckersoni TaxID=2493646 RepID=A0AAE0W3U9_9BIVA|nr:hypothetical protein CHS0354_006636 [Potamilus streckersoni]